MFGEKSRAKFIIPALLLLLGNEVISWFALVVLACVFLWSVLTEASESA